MPSPAISRYERLIREDESQALQALKVQGRAWIEGSRETRWRDGPRDEWLSRVPDLPDGAATCGQEEDHAAPCGWVLRAALSRTAHRVELETIQRTDGCRSPAVLQRATTVEAEGLPHLRIRGWYKALQCRAGASLCTAVGSLDPNLTR